MKSILPLLTLLFFSSSVGAQLNFDITTEGTTPEVEAAIEYAADIWGQYLNSDVTVKLQVAWVPLGAGTLGATLPNMRLNYPGTPEPDFWYPTSLANAISGAEQNVGEADMAIFMNSDFDYYLGTDGNPGPGQHDFVTIFLHEMVHGLGGLSLGNVVENTGSFGTQTSADLPFPVTPFPFPELEELPSIWDLYMVDLDGTPALDESAYPQPSEDLADLFTGQQLYFNGPLAVAANDGNDVRLYAPLTYASGSSLHHFNESTFAPSSDNALFTPQAGAGEVHHQPGPILMGALEDIGWTTNEVIVGIETWTHPAIGAFPNPCTDKVTITVDSPEYALWLTDASGRQIRSLNAGVNTISDLPSGMYLVTSSLHGTTATTRLLID